MSREESKQSFGIHPYRIFVYLLIGGISALFLSLSFAYLYTRVQFGIAAIKLPWIFLLNTLVLLGTSYLLLQAKKHYRQDDTERYKQALLLSILLTLVFLVGQAVGWYQLLTQNIPVNHSTGSAYLYVISGVHFLHVLVGLPFLIMFFRTAVLKMVEPVSVLLYFSDPEKKIKLELLGTYWHFLDALWIYLVIFFLINYFI